MPVTRRELIFSAALLQPSQGNVAIVLGPPGSGKTTQADFLKKKYGVPVFSAESLLKKSHDRKSDFTKKTKGKFSPEELLTDEGMNNLVREAVTKADHSKGFVVDGYPLTRSQADYLAGLLKELGLSDPVVVQLDIADDVARARLTQRGRAEDKPEIITRRLTAYRESERAVLDYYGAARVVRVDGTKPSADISRQIDAALAGRSR